MDLTPRTAAAPPARRKSPVAYAVLAVVAVAIGVVVYQALSSASLYFYNVDEAVEQRADLGDDRFRLQGTVLGEGLDETADGIEFVVRYDDVCALVRHAGDPPELFEPGIPVVLEGRWQGRSGAAGSCERTDLGRGELAFVSDRILVKHSEEYEAENSDRLDDARDGGEEPAGEPGDR